VKPTPALPTTTTKVDDTRVISDGEIAGGAFHDQVIPEQASLERQRGGWIVRRSASAASICPCTKQTSRSPSFRSRAAPTTQPGSISG